MIIAIGCIFGFIGGTLATKLEYGLNSLMGWIISVLPVLAFNVGYLVARMEGK